MPSTPPSPTRAELARELLLYKMEDYSQNGFCASWLVDLEFDLWNYADLADPTEAQVRTVSVSRECRILGEIAGGWWVYRDDTRPDGVGPVFITLDRWRQRLDQRKDKSNP